MLAANPQVDHAVVRASEIDPATWRNIRLRMRKQHGGTLEIVLLRLMQKAGMQFGVSGWVEIRRLPFRIFERKFSR